MGMGLGQPAAGREDVLGEGEGTASCREGRHNRTSTCATGFYSSVLVFLHGLFSSIQLREVSK